MLRSLILSVMLAGGLSACITAPVTVSSVADCSRLVPKGWKDGVPSAEPPTADTAANWVAFGAAQTGQLDKANGRTTDTIGIVETCEAMKAEAAKAARRPWWRFWG